MSSSNAILNRTKEQEIKILAYLRNIKEAKTQEKKTLIRQRKYQYEQMLEDEYELNKLERDISGIDVFE